MKEVNWISVEERLPQYWYSVIWTDIDCNVGEGYYDPDKEQWCSSGDSGDLFEVTHWCLFPQSINAQNLIQ